nr:MAG TPA: hypothetical protein [Caudoviricetes sp.]
MPDHRTPQTGETVQPLHLPQAFMCRCLALP